MKTSTKINLYRLCSFSWHYLLWIELTVFTMFIYGLGKLINYLVSLIGPKLPQFGGVWGTAWQFGNRLTGYSKELVIIIVLMYITVIVITKISGVHIFKSWRLTGRLHQLLINTVDQIPSSDDNKRNKAKNIDSQKANRAVRKSLVIVKKRSVLVIVRLPSQVSVRQNITGSLNGVADEFSQLLGKTSSDWQTIQGKINFASYQVMKFN